MQKLSLSILFTFSFLAATLMGQDVTFMASAKNVVRTDEQFRLVYSLNAEGKNFRAPTFEKFRVLAGPSTSSSSSIQVISRRVSAARLNIPIPLFYRLPKKECLIYRLPK
ncbi:MAG: BatD family protein [Bacteroidales bacterium]